MRWALIGIRDSRIWLKSVARQRGSPCHDSADLRPGEFDGGVGRGGVVHAFVLITGDGAPSTDRSSRVASLSTEATR